MKLFASRLSLQDLHESLYAYFWRSYFIRVELVPQNLIDHLFDNLFAAEAMLSNCGIIVTDDFNRSDTNRLYNHFKLKQLVIFPKRGQTPLGVILTI